jgi:uncharacterized membrane protein YkvA (DUF1232 family)
MSNQKFYEKLRNSIKSWVKSKTGKESKWVEYVLLAPDFFYLLFKLVQEPQIENKGKLLLAAAIAYFISPLDLLPEAILGPVGYLDDIALAAFALNSIINKYDVNLIRKYWLGEEDLLLVIRKVIFYADDLLNSQIVRHLRRLVYNTKLKTDSPNANR